MLHKITFKVCEKKFEKIKFLELFENIIFEKRIKNWKITIFSNEKSNDLKILKFIFKSEVAFKSEVLKKKNWVLLTQQKNKPVITNIFTISQKKMSNINTKNFLQIPASKAFGTGKHYSTLLAIKNIEWLLKKKNI